MKKFISMFLIFIFLFSFSACSEKTTVILDNSEKSSFVDFYTDESYAYIECELNIYAETDCTVKITALDNGNVETGLLKSPKLVGTDKNGGESFDLKSGENTVTVIFRGEYAGVFLIAKREIPRFIEITSL